MTAVPDRFAGRVAMVTGGASGIGNAVATRLAAEGALVVIGDRDADGLDRCRAELGDSAICVVTDVSDEASVQELVGAAAALRGRVDAAFNVAGIGGSGPIVDTDVGEWNRVLSVTLTGTLLVTKHVARQMIAQGSGGAIVDISSINAVHAVHGAAAYNVAKAGVTMLMKNSALELSPMGIRVNAVGPGLIDTPMTWWQREHTHIREAFLEDILLDRVGTPDDIAAAALFLASDDASFITGQSIYVDGGQLLVGYPNITELFQAVGLAGGADGVVSTREG